MTTDDRLNAVVRDMLGHERTLPPAYTEPEWSDADVARIYDTDDAEVSRLTTVNLNRDPEIERLTKLGRSL